MVDLFLLLLFSLFVVHILIRYSRTGRLASKIPGPTPLPFLGNLLLLNGSTERLWNLLHELSNKYYPTYKIWHTRSIMVLIRHPDDLKILFSSKTHIDKPAIYDLIRPWLNDSVILSTGEKWIKRRKILIPSFHFNILKKFIHVTNEHNEKFISLIQSHGDETVHNLSILLPTLTLNIFCESAMGIDLQKLDATFIEGYKGAIRDMFDVGIYRTTRPYIKDWMMPLLQIGRVQKRAVKILHDFRNKMIQERRKYHESTGYQTFHDYHKDVAENKEIGCKKTLSALDLLLALQQDGDIDEEGVNEEVDTFIIGGHDTTAIASTYLLLLLAENKYAQDLARAEIVRVLDESKSEITSVIHKFDYLDRCIKESLRIFAAVPIIVRYLKEDLQLKNYLVPAGSDVLCMIRATHLDPDFWPEPTKFDPDRFLPANVDNRHPYAYVPFSLGPRNCIGQKLALLQMKTLVAGILYNFYLEPVDRSADVKFSMNATLHSTKPIHVKFVKIVK